MGSVKMRNKTEKNPPLFCGGCGKVMSYNANTKTLVFDARFKNHWDSLSEVRDYERRGFPMSYQVYCGDCIKWMNIKKVKK